MTRLSSEHLVPLVNETSHGTDNDDPVLFFSVVEHDVIFFCRDARIVPSLAQQKFAMNELEGPTVVRFYNMSDRLVCDLRDVLQTECHWPDGLVSKEATTRSSNCRELRCRGSPWTSKRQNGGRQDQPDVDERVVERSTVFANHVVARLMLVMNRNQFNLFSIVQLGSAGAEKKNHLIFKQSSVRYDDSICLHLSGTF